MQSSSVLRARVRLNVGTKKRAVPAGPAQPRHAIPRTRAVWPRTSALRLPKSAGPVRGAVGWDAPLTARGERAAPQRARLGADECRGGGRALPARRARGPPRAPRAADVKFQAPGLCLGRDGERLARGGGRRASHTIRRTCRFLRQCVCQRQTAAAAVPPTSPGVSLFVSAVLVSPFLSYRRLHVHVHTHTKHTSSPPSFLVRDVCGEGRERRRKEGSPTAPLLLPRPPPTPLPSSLFVPPPPHRPPKHTPSRTRPAIRDRKRPQPW
jgi:hypothetical protein